MIDIFKSKSYEIDSFFQKFEKKEYNTIEQVEFEEIVRSINYVFNGGDEILEQLSKDELIQRLDHLSRAMTHCKLDRRNKHYIFSNLYKLKEGISSESRRKFFKEKLDVIEDELNIDSIYVKFRFGFINNEPFLLMRHSYGTNSIMNLTEKVLSTIEYNYLKHYGFELVEHVNHLYFIDASFEIGKGPCERVSIGKHFKNPEWQVFDEKQFEKLWDALNPNEEIQPIFFEPNQPLKAYNLIKELFIRAKKKIQIIDPYFDKTIYSLIGELNSDIQIQLISEKAMGDASIVYQKMKNERGKIEVKTSNSNHDRFIIIDDKQVYLLGSSINSIGNKASMILPLEVNTVKQEIKNYFKKQWNEAKELK